MSPSKSGPSFRPADVVPRGALARFSRGREFRLWQALGAHPTERDGVPGVRFAVWAPNAKRVDVVGDFNRWEPGESPLRRRGKSGVWEAFVPDAARGAIYKYLVRTRLGGRRILKADPVAFAAELRPQSGSVVSGLGTYEWGDRKWMVGRRTRQRFDRPMSIYEVHLGSWRRGPGGGAWRTAAQLADELISYARNQGHTHLELMPITEHPFDGSWGYQTTGYFAPTARFGTPDDLRGFIDAAHRAELGVILDWAPAHFPRDGHGLGFFDGTAAYELADPQRNVHPDWDTYVFDFGKPEVVSFLVSSALYWLEEFHFDGIRVDAVASMLYLDYSRRPEEWTPNVKGGNENLEALEFVKTLNSTIHKRCPGALSIAEESTSWPGVTKPVADGGLGFDLKWNMGWMNDTLSYFGKDPLERSWHQKKLTFSLTYAFDEKYLLPLSHDEVVHTKASLLSKMPGPREQRFAGMRALLGYMAAHPGKKLLFMGGELGQWSEWDHDGELEWDLLDHAVHRELHLYSRELNRFYLASPELWQRDDGWGGFEWIDFSDEKRSVIAFVRRAKKKGDHLVVVANFTPIPWKSYRLGVPHKRAYRVAFNSDEARFGGKATELPAELAVEDTPKHGRDASVVLTLPPLSVLFLAPVAARRIRAAVTRPARSR